MKKIFFTLFCGLLALHAWAQVPTITNISPTSGGAGTTVTITGTNFDTPFANNRVWFGGVQLLLLQEALLR